MDTAMAALMIFGVFACGANNALALDKGEFLKALGYAVWAVFLGMYAILWTLRQ